ncbi:hypothetical protein KY284_032510 [Solanum tuberosum]|nr:hypothetical protein KY284_032510 [Solanum tuberosum]
MSPPALLNNLNSAVITKDLSSGRVKGTGRIRHGLYILSDAVKNWSPTKKGIHVAATAKRKDKVDLWHMRGCFPFHGCPQLFPAAQGGVYQFKDLQLANYSFQHTDREIHVDEPPLVEAVDPPLVDANDVSINESVIPEDTPAGGDDIKVHMQLI